MLERLFNIELTIYLKSGNKFVVYCKDYNFKYDQNANTFTSYQINGLRSSARVAILLDRVESISSRKVWFWK